jgi:hypothetical protein
MAKDWRRAVCTRWRPLATIVLIIGFFIVIPFLVDMISPDKLGLERLCAAVILPTSWDPPTVAGRPIQAVLFGGEK